MNNLLRSIFIILILILTSLSLSSCSTSKKSPAPIVDGSVHTERATTQSPTYIKELPHDKGLAIYNFAHGFIGAPYRYGGEDPSGFDCSGLVQYTHQNFGINIPRTANDQFKSAYKISRAELKPGDVIFFRFNRRNISHVGIYAGHGKFIHAPSTGKRVTISSLSEPYWQRRVAKTGRFY